VYVISIHDVLLQMGESSKRDIAKISAIHQQAAASKPSKVLSCEFAENKNELN